MEVEQKKEEISRQKRQLESMKSKVEVFRGTMEDQNTDRLALIKEKDVLFKEHVQLKSFIPEFEQMEKSSNKLKYLIDMKARQSKDDFLNYLYQFTFVQQRRMDEIQQKFEAQQKQLEQRDITISNLELTNDDLKKQLDARKKQIAKMKDEGMGMKNVKNEAMLKSTKETNDLIDITLSQRSSKKRKFNEISNSINQYLIMPQSTLDGKTTASEKNEIAGDVDLFISSQDSMAMPMQA